MFDLDTGKSRQTFGPTSEYCRSLALTSDGQSLAVVGNGLRLSFWNPDGLSQAPQTLMQLRLPLTGWGDLRPRSRVGAGSETRPGPSSRAG